MAVDLAMHPICNNVDLGWSGVFTTDISNSFSCEMDAHAARRSMQYDPEISMQLSCPPDSFSKAEQLLPSETSELFQRLQVQQQQQQQQQLQLALAQLETQSDGETEIDAQIQQLLQLKRFLRRSKQAATQQQQQQVILEDVALADVSNGLDASASGLFASSGLATPARQSESLLGGAPDLGAQNWDNLPAACAAAQPSRHSIDMGGLAHQLAAIEMSNKAARTVLVESRGMRPSASFNASLNNRLSVDCSGPGMITDDLIAAAAMAAAANAAQAEAASRRTSLCMPGPQVGPSMSGLLDSMLLDSMGAASLAQLQAPTDAMSGGAALALQSALYAVSPATSALDAQVQVPVSTAASMSMTSPARHSLDLGLLSAIAGLSPAGLSPAGLSPAGLGPMAGMASPAGLQAPALPSPVYGRASLQLLQSPLLGDRGAAVVQSQAQAHAQAQAQNDSGGWCFSARRSDGRRTSVDVRRSSSELLRSHTPDLRRQLPHKSVSFTSSAGTSASSSGRSSPRSKLAAAQAGNRRTSMDRPPLQPPRLSPVLNNDSGAGCSAATAPACAPPARRGTGVFIPPCMIKSPASS